MCQCHPAMGIPLPLVLVLCVQWSPAWVTGPSSARWKCSVTTVPSPATTGCAVRPGSFLSPSMSLDPSLTSPPPFSTPGSPLLESKATPGTVGPTRGSGGSNDYQQGHPTQQPRPLDTSSLVTQRHFDPETLSPRALRGTSPATPVGPPWVWTQAAVPTSKDQGQPREDPNHPGTSLPATSLVT
jgi:hypothetical protein